MKDVGVCLTLLFAVVSCAFGASISFEPTVSTVMPGQTFAVAINISGAADLYAFQFDLGFDPLVLAAITVEQGSLLPTGGATFFAPGAIDNINGSITSTADSLLGVIAGVTGSGSLATVHFQAAGSGSTQLSISNLVFLDSALNDVAVEAGAGVVNVVPEPSTVLLMPAGFIVLFAAAVKRVRDQK